MYTSTHLFEAPFHLASSVPRARCRANPPSPGSSSACWGSRGLRGRRACRRPNAAAGRHRRRRHLPSAGLEEAAEVAAVVSVRPVRPSLRRRRRRRDRGRLHRTSCRGLRHRRHRGRRLTWNRPNWTSWSLAEDRGDRISNRSADGVYYLHGDRSEIRLINALHKRQSGTHQTGFDRVSRIHWRGRRDRDCRHCRYCRRRPPRPSSCSQWDSGACGPRDSVEPAS